MQWNAKSLVHNGQNRIAVYFEKDEGAIKRIKLLTGVMWSVSLKAWHLPDTIENRKKFKIALEIKKNEDHIAKQEQFKLWLKSKRYSENTVKTYCDALNSFLLFL